MDEVIKIKEAKGMIDRRIELLQNLLNEERRCFDYENVDVVKGRIAMIEKELTDLIILEKLAKDRLFEIRKSNVIKEQSVKKPTSLEMNEKLKKLQGPNYRQEAIESTKQMNEDFKKNPQPLLDYLEKTGQIRKYNKDRSLEIEDPDQEEEAFQKSFQQGLEEGLGGQGKQLTRNPLEHDPGKEEELLMGDLKWAMDKIDGKHQQPKKDLSEYVSDEEEGKNPMIITGKEIEENEQAQSRAIQKACQKVAEYKAKKDPNKKSKPVAD